MNSTQRAWAEIDLDTIAENVRQIKKIIRPGTKLMGVVKADAYGHGVEKTAKTILENGAEALAVAFIEEAIQLRNCDITVPILVLGSFEDCAIDDFIKYDIMPTVFSFELASKFSQRATALGKLAKIHLKVDTGMHRLGLLYSESKQEKQETIESIVQISKMPGILIEGIFSHLSTADEEDTSYAYLQFDRFKELIAVLEKEGVKIPCHHIANSAALIRFPEMQMDMVRAGVIMYGMYPAKNLKLAGLDVRPAMKLKARVINIKEVDKGYDISYGRTFTTSKPTKIATIAIGYADGYSRVLSDKVEVLVNGQRAKQIGRICMDQCMIDVTNVNNINIGDKVTLFGSDKGENIPIEDVAEVMGTINYEIACLVSKRIPRVYIKDGVAAGSKNYLLPEYSK